jgi:hypothetical protein
VTTGQVEYVHIGLGANNAAPQVEGQTKAEATASTSLRTEVLVTIANWITASRQQISDSPQLFDLLSDSFRHRVLSAPPMRPPRS